MTYATNAASSSSLHAVVTRADGTVEDLGMIAYWHKNPFKRFAWNVYRFIKGI
jgi:hypothetical protein